MESVIAIKYNKQSGEYCIKSRDTETGKQSCTYANRLTEEEVAFAKSADFTEDKFSAQWV